MRAVTGQLRPDETRGGAARPGNWLAGLMALVAVGLVALYFVRAPSPLPPVRPALLAASVAVYLGAMAVRTWRLAVLLQAPRGTFRGLLRVQCLGGVLGAASPGRVAEAAKIALLHRAGFGLERATLAFAVEKTQDVGMIAASGLACVWVLGSLAIVPEWLRESFLPIAALLVVAASIALFIHLWRTASALGHLGVILVASLGVFAGAFASAYIVFADHGIFDVGKVLAIFTLTVLAGALSMLPGGGQGVVQFAFHHAAMTLFGIDDEITVSMVLHITLGYYLGLAASAIVAWGLRRAPLQG